MATNPTKKPSDHQRLEAADAKRKRKQEIDKKSREKKKNKQDNNEAQLKTLQDECNYYKGQVDLCKSMMKPLLDDTCQIGKFVQELGESRGHARDTVEKQTGMVNECWDIIKRKNITQPLPGGSSSISTSTDKDAYPPLELSVAAIKSDGSVTSESFKPCQSLPEEWTPLATGEQERLIRAFFGLREHYTATTVRHAREIADRDRELISLKEELAGAQDMPYSNLFKEQEPPTL
ncbi:PREDICTED: uncharacterized protein LOC105120737 isoform X3 [Populus euphratica]|uniref:Uncharacterized protein LOC105120737 isoform X3 n=1 Tax=Populus euphratica TaxID=75702 RepID=A0AAJ6XG42_POPEU|nr:PREDICTED: uncharacterized protein LOC105120737 isoform X3 [Populus euphratica]